MSQELLYTSAPYGLKPGSRGFCTVLSTQGMPAPLATALESLSGYRPAFPPSDPQSHLNPVVMSHLTVQVAGRSWHVLSRIADYGLDYSQRPNKLAHHVVLDPGELVEAGPAELLNVPSFMRTEWHEDPRLVPAKSVKRVGSIPRGVCQAWKDMTGDAGWAGVLAESFLRDPERPVFLLFEPGQEVLPLIAEALSLLPPPRRWEVTFSTYFTGLPQGASCAWRCMLAGSAEAHQSLRFAKALRIDLTAASFAEATGGALVQAARSQVRHQGASSRKPPALPAGQVANAEVDEPSHADQEDADAEYDLAGPNADAPPLPLRNVLHPRDRRLTKAGGRRSQQGSETAEVGPLNRRRTWIVLGIALVGLLVIGSGVGIFLSQWLQHRPSELVVRQQPGESDLETSDGDSTGNKPNPQTKKKASSIVATNSVTQSKATADGSTVPVKKKPTTSNGNSQNASDNQAASAPGKADIPNKSNAVPDDTPSADKTKPAPAAANLKSKDKGPPSSSEFVLLDARINNHTVLLSGQTKPINQLTLWAPEEMHLKSKAVSTGSDKLQISEHGGAILAVISAEKKMPEGTHPDETHQLTLTARSAKVNRLKWCELDVPEGSPDKIVFHKFPHAIPPTQRAFAPPTDRGVPAYAIRWTLDAESDETHMVAFQIEKVALQIGGSTYPFETTHSKQPQKSPLEVELQSNELTNKLKSLLPTVSNGASTGGVSLKLTSAIKRVAGQSHGPVALTLTLDGFSKVWSDARSHYEKSIGSGSKWRQTLAEIGRSGRQVKFKTIRFTSPTDESIVAQLQARIDFLGDCSQDLQAENQKASQMKLQALVNEINGTRMELEKLATVFKGIEAFEAEMTKATVKSLSVFYPVIDAGGNSRNVYVIRLEEP